EPTPIWKNTCFGAEILIDTVKPTQTKKSKAKTETRFEKAASSAASTHAGKSNYFLLACRVQVAFDCRAAIISDLDCYRVCSLYYHSLFRYMALRISKKGAYVSQGLYPLPLVLDNMTPSNFFDDIP